MRGEVLHIGAGIALAIAAWLLPRRVARAQWRPMGRPLRRNLPALLLDAFPVALLWGLLLAATARPLFAGVTVLALIGGLALADRVKRDTLREPVVFSDMAELPYVFTHPHLYLPFAGTGTVIGGAVLALMAAVALLLLEAGLWHFTPLPIVVVGGLIGAAGWGLAREPALGRAAALLRRLQPSGDPIADGARLGPLATLYVYGIIARHERAARRARVAAPAVLPDRSQRVPLERAMPIVLVQCESFFDARRLAPQLFAGLLPGFAACCADRATFGRFDVSGWGANTMRAEFAALTGIADSELGYDRFNPYHAFARVPIASLAWRLRAAGYRTICLHPFDRWFYRRDLAFPGLGFERFLGRESLGGSRRPPYCSDPEFAGHILRALDTEGPRVFLFAITMGNHGPWSIAKPAGTDPTLRPLFAADGVPQGGELLHYLDGLSRSDAMLQILRRGFEERGLDGILAFYGDHLPSLPHAFSHFGFDEWASDYVLWRNGATQSRRLDLPAHRLADLILDTLRARQPAAAEADGALG
jgi:hypothetical protein